jgi:hypothetical protein
MWETYRMLGAERERELHELAARAKEPAADRVESAGILSRLAKVLASSGHVVRRAAAGRAYRRGRSLHE